jgi:SM-20-related protein
MQSRFDPLIDSFIDHHLGIHPSFLSEELASGLRQNIMQLLEEDKMVPAGVGHGNNKLNDKKVRGDKICWMDRSHDNVYEQAFLDLVEDFIDYLNRTCYTGINGYEFHYTVYEEGSFYTRHRDQFKTNSHRKYSLINYLNENWQETDGGILQVYEEETIKKIIPHSGTTVFFKSDEVDHEVTLAHKPRMSITGWLKQV